MPHTRYIVTELNLAEGYGFVRLIETDGLNPDAGKTIRFETDRATEILFTNGSATGYRSATNPVITQRTPAIGDELFGSTAYDMHPWHIATGPDGNPFLRNWGYADQPDFGPYADMFYDEFDDFDDAPDEDYCDPYDEYDQYDEVDEDPLIGDIDDGSHYTPEPSPVNTQHYFALKARGHI
jgi:hypothetical protein